MLGSKVHLNNLENFKNTMRWNKQFISSLSENPPEEGLPCLYDTKDYSSKIL